MSVITGQGVTAYPLPDEELSPTSKNAVSNEAVCEGLDEIKNTLNHKADVIYDTASGDIASFPDGADGLPVKDLTVAIEPVQDLHGYENPWPAGGGKNLLDDSNLRRGYLNPQTANFVADTNYITYTVSLPSGTYTFSTDLENCYLVRWFVNNVAHEIMTATNITSITLETSAALSIVIRNTSTSDIASITPHSMIEAGSTATAYAPYSNICPISGFTGMNVTRAGKNILDASSLTWTMGILDDNGNPTSSDTSHYSNAIRVDGGKAYTINGTLTSGVSTYRIYFRDAYQNWISRTATIENAPYTFTTPQNCRFIQIQCRNILTLSDAQLEAGSTASPYEPFGQVYPITFPSGTTVYGGTPKLPSCVLTVDKSADFLPTSGWEMVSGGGLFYNDSALPDSNHNDSNSEWKCDRYIVANAVSNSTTAKNRPDFTIMSMTGTTYTRRIFVRDSRYSSADDFMASLSTPIELFYELASPQTVTLTPTEVITTLLGQNNIWADCGPVSVEYPCDTKLYIERLTAPEEDDMIANQNIASGVYFMVGNNLYLSTATITAGEAIVPGTGGNCTALSLADALNNLNS